MADLTLQLYVPYLRAAVDAETTWAASAALTLTLHTSAYVPNRVTHASVADLTNELATGGGYTQGGVTLSNPTAVVVAANSWSAQWQATTAYEVGQIVRPTAGNGLLYRVAVAGTSGGAQPTFPTVAGQCVTDGTVEWVCVGIAAVVLDADDLVPAWAAFTAGPFRHVVLSDRAAALAADQPLIGFYDFGSDQTGGGGDFNITFDSSGGVIAIPVP